MDIASPDSGVIKEFFTAEGDTVAVGANFFDLDTDAKGGAAASKPAATPAPEAPKVSYSFI